jgi:biopolymer transport protein ExbB
MNADGKSQENFMGRVKGWTQGTLFGWLSAAAIITAVAVLATAAGRPALAQEKDEDVINEEAAPPAEAPPAADEATEPAAEAETEEEKAAAPIAPPQSYLGWLWRAMGPLYSIVFLILSFALVAVLVMNVLSSRREHLLPTPLIESFESHLNAKRYQEAYELAKNDESFLGKVLSAGLARISSGYPQAIEAMQEVGEEENMRLEHRLSYLALIGSISPMFGLLGTVHGMVDAFSVIAQSTVTPKPAELAQGIMTALVTTLVGLWLAIPAICAFNILRNFTNRHVLEVGIISENLMSRFQNVSATKAP